MSLVEHLPDFMLAPGPRGLAWWQWAALPLLFVVAWTLGLLLGRLTRAVLHLLARRTTATWDDQLLDNIGGPLALAWTVAVAHVLLPVLRLHGAAEATVGKGLRTAVPLAFFWFLLRVVTVLGAFISGSTWAVARPATRSLVPLGARILQIGVLAMGVVTVLADFGYPVASLVAGLGIGGLALALAGQKTVENLFGAFSIGVDQPFQLGDFVSVEGVQGHVERIGLRSTRIRTMDRTLITIPNGKLADMRIETYAPRDRIRLGCTLSLVYGTTAAQLRAVIAGCEGLLREHPKVWPDGIVVSFKELAAHSLDIEVMAWFRTTDFAEFRVIRQDLLLGFMEVIDRAETSFAFPTRTVHMRQADAPQRG